METEKVTRYGLYPVVGEPSHKVRARWTGEKRPPLKGEWFLSGSIISAYQTRNDLSMDYHIAELVTVESTTSYHVTGVYKLGGKR